MHPAFRSGLSVAALTPAFILAGCHPAPLGKGRNHADRAVSVVSSLICPPRQGALVRTDSDERHCRYTGPDQRVVEVSLLALDGRSATQALAPIETRLRAELGPTAPATSDKTDADDDASDEDAAPVRDAGGRTDPSPARGGRAHDHVSINLPGLHIDADDGGAHVRALGETIDAGSHGGATVTGGWNGSTNAIKADDHGVEMRLGFVGRAAVDLTLILDRASRGAGSSSLVGYVARGPVAGPLVLATIVANPAGAHLSHDVDLKDMRALVGANLATGPGPNPGR